MKMMTTDEAAHMFGLESPGELDKQVRWHDLSITTYRLPRNSESQANLAKRLGSVCCKDKDCWLQLTYWHDDHGANQDLFYGYLRGQGYQQRLSDDCSIYLFSPQEVEQFVSVFSMILYFDWDASIFDANISYCIQVSHDEWIDCASNNPTTQNEIKEAISSWVLPWP